MTDSGPSSDQDKTGSSSPSPDQYFHWYDAEYLGGHALFLERRRCTLSLYPTKAVISDKNKTTHSTKLDLHIPYTVIKEVKNVTEEQVDAMRVLAFGTAGALWKKKETYLCIVYNDGTQDQNLVLKVQGLERAQKRLYEHLVKSRTKSKEATQTETLFVACEYCRARYDANKHFKCPNCGATNK